jgi:hypothetical protein
MPAFWSKLVENRPGKVNTLSFMGTFTRPMVRWLVPARRLYGIFSWPLAETRAFYRK